MFMLNILFSLRPHYLRKSSLDAILQKYARYTTWSLVELSHQQDPWKYQHEIFGDKALIPFKSIADYFGKDTAS